MILYFSPWTNLFHLDTHYFHLYTPWIVVNCENDITIPYFFTHSSFPVYGIVVIIPGFVWHFQIKRSFLVECDNQDFDVVNLLDFL